MTLGREIGEAEVSRVSLHRCAIRDSGARTRKRGASRSASTSIMTMAVLLLIGHMLPEAKVVDVPSQQPSVAISLAMEEARAPEERAETDLGRKEGPIITLPHANLGLDRIGLDGDSKGMGWSGEEQDDMKRKDVGESIQESVSNQCHFSKGLVGGLAGTKEHGIQSSLGKHALRALRPHRTSHSSASIIGPDEVRLNSRLVLTGQSH